MRTAAHIIETVGKLVKKYDTRDPYELCKCLEIKIHFYNLEKKLKGFFFYQSRQKNIVIDSNVNDVLERIRPHFYRLVNTNALDFRKLRDGSIK